MKKAVIFLPLNDELQFENIHLPAYINDDINFDIVHCHKIHTYVNELSMYAFPNENDFPSMTEATKVMLDNFAKSKNLKNYTSHVFFDYSPKDKCLNYLKDNKVDFCIILGSHKSSFEMFFEGSFMSYLNKYAPCDVINLRA